MSQEGFERATQCLSCERLEMPQTEGRCGRNYPFEAEVRLNNLRNSERTSKKTAFNLYKDQLVYNV
jgi:hypothetical protein